MGDLIFSAEKGPVDSAEILKNPLNEKITFSPSMFGIPELKNILTDTHFVVRDRMGRILSFLANIFVSKNSGIQGLGIDENTVLLLNSEGSAHVMGGGTVYLLRPTTIPLIEKDHFNWKKINVFRWKDGDSFSFANLVNPDYSYNVENGVIISTQADGKIY